MRTETRTYTLYQITGSYPGKPKKRRITNGYATDTFTVGQTRTVTFDTFCERFGIVCGNWRYDESHYSYHYRSRQEDYIDKLSGWRLATYLTNNHWSDLYTPKFYWNGRKAEKAEYL